MRSIDVARDALAIAEGRSGATVRTVSSLDDLEQARAVFDETWPIVGGGSNLPSNLFRALAHAGAYACAAYVDGLLAGATVAFLARTRIDEATWQVTLHSHMAAVRDGYRNRSIGTAMKCHQRLWALEHDIEVIAWTFDPLVRRNARVNMLKLGALVRGYEINFYGRMDDDYDFDDESDRVFAWWEVDSERANSAALGGLAPWSEQERASHPDPIVVEIPPDIVALRETDPEAAREWRWRVREQMLAALAQGYRVTGLTSDGNYVMERTPA